MERHDRTFDTALRYRSVSRIAIRVGCISVLNRRAC